MIFFIIIFQPNFIIHSKLGWKNTKKIIQAQKKNALPIFPIVERRNHEKKGTKKIMGKFIPNGNESTFSSETLSSFFSIPLLLNSYYFPYQKQQQTQKKTMKIVVGAFLCSLSSEKYIYKI